MLGEITEADIRRFWSYVDRTGECWLWTGGKGKRGYGVFHIDNRAYNAHRIAYLIQFGEWPGGNDVCHRCDVRACQRGAHLFLGDAAANLQDMSAKGRWRNQSTLSPAAVREIRALWAAGGTTQREIGKRFGLSQPTISEIVRGILWRNVS